MSIDTKNVMDDTIRLMYETYRQSQLASKPVKADSLRPQEQQSANVNPEDATLSVAMMNKNDASLQHDSNLSIDSDDSPESISSSPMVKK
mgnify:CR=1 FL=1